jgi:inward rectifier potassium channel
MECNTVIMRGARNRIVVSVTGLDETILQPVHGRTSYLPHEVLWGHRLADVFTPTEGGRLAIDYRRFHDTEPVPPPAPSESNNAPASDQKVM